MEIERLYDGFAGGKEISEEARNEERRLVREIQAHAIILPDPFGPRIYKLSSFIGEDAIEHLQGDRVRLVMWKSCQYGKDLANAFILRNEAPPVPDFYKAYAVAMDEYAEIMEEQYQAQTNWMEERTRERQGKANPARGSEDVDNQ